MNDLAAASNAFAFDLYAQLRTGDGDLFFSPYSILTALAMTSAGARGQTLADMSRVLHLPGQAELHPSAALLTEENAAARARRSSWRPPTPSGRRRADRCATISCP